MGVVDGGGCLAVRSLVAHSGPGLGLGVDVLIVLTRDEGGTWGEVYVAPGGPATLMGVLGAPLAPADDFAPPG